MEHFLLELARKLDALDESSIMSLWDKYANIVAHFESTKHWEEAVLVLGLIQAKHMKNQLFNINFADRLRNHQHSDVLDRLNFTIDEPGLNTFAGKNAPARRQTKHQSALTKPFKAEILTFQRPED